MFRPTRYLALSPPPFLERVQEDLQTLAWKLKASITLVADGLDAFDPDKIEQATRELNAVGSLAELAAAKLIRLCG